MVRLAILGSTGSIGTQALDVVSRHRDEFSVTALAARSNGELLNRQVKDFQVKYAVLTRPKDGFVPESGAEWGFSDEAMSDLCALPDVDAVLVSVVGIAGLPLVLAAIEHGKKVLLANKEALVTGGKLVMDAAKRKNVSLLPVDSEHSAIFQCIQGNPNKNPCGIVLTASGGPFRTFTKEQIKNATVEQALRHPNWSMGSKITIDSASMVNKALEVIEAKWLFSMEPKDIQVVVHPESIVHSGVKFRDGATLVQMGLPDMRVPIAYAMSYPERLPEVSAPLDLTKFGTLHFEQPDFEKFPALGLVYPVLKTGGNAPVLFNGANEEAVSAVLQKRLPFYAIADVLSETLERVPVQEISCIEQVYEADRLARAVAKAIISDKY